MNEVQQPRWLDSDAVTRERDPEAWGELDLWDEGIQVWRRAGFSLAEATRWMDTVREIVAGDEDVTDDDETTKSAVAAGLIVAGLEPSEAGDWARVLPWRECLDLPSAVVEWRAAGFTPDSARPWAAHEDIASSALLANGGWSTEERDLLDAWLTVQSVAGRRIDWLSTPASPAHVLDYVRAGMEPREAAYYERAWREGRDVTGELRQRPPSPELADEAVVERLVAATQRLGPRREGLHADPLPRLGPRTGGLSHEPLAPLPANFSVPEWSGKSLGSELGTWQRGYGEWEGGGPPEDSACPPVLGWTEEHRALVLDAYTKQWGDTLGQRGSCDISWPPRASMWSAGNATEGDGEVCSEHEGAPDRLCDECQSGEDVEPDLEPAEWHWYIEVTAYVDDGDELYEEGPDQDQIMTTYMDPRVVEYTEAGVRPGDHY